MFPRWLFWPLFWAVMGFAAGGSFVSATTKPIYQITHSAKEQTATNSSREREPDETTWNWLTHEAVGFFTFWLVIVAVGQLALFLWQLVLIRQSLIDAKIAAEAAKESADATTRIASADRAWICVEEVPSGEMINAFIDDVPCARGFLVWSKWRNVGRSPALRTTIHSDRRLIGPGEPIPVFTCTPVIDLRHGTIGPAIPIESPRVALAEAEYIALENRKVRMIAYFAATYFDVYSPEIERLSEVCIEFVIDGRRVKPDGTSIPNTRSTPVGPQNRTT